MLFGRLEAAPEFRCELSDLPFPVATSSQIFCCIDHVPVLPGDWQQHFVDCHLGVSRHFVAHHEASLVSHILGCLNRPQPRQATAVHLGLVRSLVCDGNRGFNIDIHLCVLDVLFSKAERTHHAARYPPVAAGNSNGDYVFTLTPPLLRLVLPIFSVVGFRDCGGWAFRRRAGPDLCTGPALRWNPMSCGQLRGQVVAFVAFVVVGGVWVEFSSIFRRFIAGFLYFSSIYC